MTDTDTDTDTTRYCPRKIILGADADGKPIQVLVLDNEVSRILDERTRYWAAQENTSGKSPLMAAVAELVWAGRQEGPVVEMYGDPGAGWCISLLSLAGRPQRRAARDLALRAAAAEAIAGGSEVMVSDPVAQPRQRHSRRSWLRRRGSH